MVIRSDFSTCSSDICDASCCGRIRIAIKDVGRHVKQGKTCGAKGVGPKCSTLKPSSLVSVTACHGKAAVCQGLKVLSPDIFDNHIMLQYAEPTRTNIYVRKRSYVSVMFGFMKKKVVSSSRRGGSSNNNSNNSSSSSSSSRAGSASLYARLVGLTLAPFVLVQSYSTSLLYVSCFPPRNAA